MSENQIPDPTLTHAETCIKEANDLWAEISKSVPGLLKEIQRGKPIFYSGLSPAWSQLCQLHTKLHSLAQNDQPAADEDPAPPSAHISALQRFVDDYLQEYVSDNHLDPAMLESDRLSHRFRYSTIETVYSSGTEIVKIPEALLDHDEELLERIRREVYNNGDCYDHFSPEVNDSDVQDSELEVEEE